ncbi:neural cell adhesion molecule 1-like [Aquarana catesbeiana]|uniref:neural cell adhesion molecule 1-like n=1 Tax=Aquarana catesbeiana TaxID=8400 RepID=UPI003CC9363C
MKESLSEFSLLLCEQSLGNWSDLVIVLNSCGHRGGGVPTLPKRETNNIMNGRTVWLFLLLCSTGAAALQMTGPSTYKARVGAIAHIPCTFKADNLPADPKDLTVLWYLEKNIILGYDKTPTDPRYSLDKDRALNGIANLTISNTFLSDGGTYTCAVTIEPLRKEIDIRVEISGGALQMTGPSTYEARVGSIAHIPCTFTADILPADPRYFAVVWDLEGKPILSYNNTVIPTDPRYSMDNDRALKGNADLTIYDTSVSDGGVYTCSVNYSSFLMKREISMNVSARPLLSILSKSVQRNTENTLTCMANGFFPNDINVTWYKDGEVLKNQSMGKPLQYDNGTYQVNSTVTITPNDDDHNKMLSCRIQHVSLQGPLQEDFQITYQGSSSYVGIIIGSVIAVLFGIIVAVWCRRKKICTKGKEKKQNRSTQKNGSENPESSEILLENKKNSQSQGIQEEKGETQKENPETSENEEDVL